MTSDTRLHDVSLKDLARSAGLITDWQDIGGRWHQVPAATLQQVLATFGIRARSPRQIRAALDEWRHDIGTQLPPMITADRGSLVNLGRARGRLPQAAISLEGETRDRPVTLNSVDGMIWLRTPRRIGYHRLRLGRQHVTLAVAPPRCITCRDLMDNRRGWGLSAQIYALYRADDEGAGDFSSLHQLAVGSARAGAAALAISPLHAQFSADSSHFSPYSPSSRLWLNALLIDAEAAWQDVAPDAGEKQISKRKTAKKPGLIDWPGIAEYKLSSLTRLFHVLQEQRAFDEAQSIGKSFQSFLQAGGPALAAHGLFEALHASFLAQSKDLWHWRNWPSRYRDPVSTACREFRRQHPDLVTFHLFLQWLAARQLQGVTAVCRRQMPIGLISDIAVGSDSGGSQAWAHRQEMLDGLSIGSPPDDFNASGQNWGVTSFSPHGLQASSYRPFIDLLRSSLQYAGGIRLDHILGLARLWVVPHGNDATNGVYMKYPIDDLLRLTALESYRANAFILGEDLGTVPPGFREKLRDAGVAGMQVLWFERNDGGFTKPQDWSPQAVGMTSTHDLPTVAGWWRGSDIDWRRKTATTADNVDARQLQGQRRQDRQRLWEGLTSANAARGDQPSTGDTAKVVDAAVNFLGKTACDLTLLPLEDAIGTMDQSNLPGTIDEHPNWRRRLPLTTEQIFQDSTIKDRFRDLKRRRART